MSETAVAELNKTLRNRLLDHLWRQWRAIGATVSGSGTAQSIVDPEALILASLWMLDDERRLGDVLASWVKVNSSLLSIQRLRNLRDDYPTVVASRLSSLAALGIAQAKDSRWRSLLTRNQTPFEVRDEKTRAVAVRFETWATLLLQLRQGMGVGAKADVLAFLLGTGFNQVEWSSVAMIAEATGYTPAAVRRVADDLAAAQFIRVPGKAVSDRSLQRMYHAEPATWAQVLRVTPHQPGWGSWRERILFIVDVLTWLESLGHRRVTAYARDVEARNLLARHGAAFRRDPAIVPSELDGSDLDAAYLEKVALALLHWTSNNG